MLAGVNIADVLGSVKADGDGDLKGRRDRKCHAYEIRTTKLFGPGAPNVFCSPQSSVCFTSTSPSIIKVVSQAKKRKRW